MEEIPKKEEPKEEEPKGKDVVSKWIGVVYICNVPHDVYLTDWRTTTGELGSILPEANKVYISKYQNPHNQLITLAHEMLHKIILEYHLDISDATTIWGLHEKIVGVLDGPIVNDLILHPNNTDFFSKVLKGEFSEEEK